MKFKGFLRILLISLLGGIIVVCAQIIASEYFEYLRFQDSLYQPPEMEEGESRLFFCVRRQNFYAERDGPKVAALMRSSCGLPALEWELPNGRTNIQIFWDVRSALNFRQFIGNMQKRGAGGYVRNLNNLRDADGLKALIILSFGRPLVFEEYRNKILTDKWEHWSVEKGTSEETIQRKFKKEHPTI